MLVFTGGKKTLVSSRGLDAAEPVTKERIYSAEEREFLYFPVCKMLGGRMGEN